MGGRWQQNFKKKIFSHHFCPDFQYNLPFFLPGIGINDKPNRITMLVFNSVLPILTYQYLVGTLLVVGLQYLLFQPLRIDVAVLTCLFYQRHILCPHTIVQKCTVYSFSHLAQFYR